MTARSQSSDSLTISKASLRRLGLAIVAVVVLALAAVAVAAAIRSFGPGDTLASAINSSEYQAVFLTNGQVYFGKLSAPGTDFYELRRVYYLSSQVSPQSPKTPHQTLIKLGSEIHGPEDLMVINRSQILFVENLKPNGEVTRAIQNGSASP